LSVNKKEITYDTREPKEFVDFLKQQLPDFTFHPKFMPVGDFEVNGIILERKTAEDYIGSMKDGRLNNQLVSMSYNYVFSYLVITGNLWQTAFRQQVPRPTVVSSLIGDSFKRSPEGKMGQIVTIQLETNFEFALFLKYLAGKEKIRLPKPTRITVSKNDRIIATLASFPGWGEALSKRALKVFGTIEKMTKTTPEELAKSVYGCGLAKSKGFHKHLKEKYEE
jgi:ERCC4-type nuclease